MKCNLLKDLSNGVPGSHATAKGAAWRGEDVGQALFNAPPNPTAAAAAPAGEVGGARQG